MNTSKLEWVVEELVKLATLLRPGGTLWLFYEAFTDEKAEELEATLVRRLGATGLEPVVKRRGRRLAINATV